MTIQGRWRLAGGLALAIAALMAWYGVDAGLMIGNVYSTLGYWGFWLILLMVAFYSVLLDLRFTRLQYKLEQKRLFQDTFDNEDFRKIVAEEVQRHKKEKNARNQKDGDES